MTEVETSTPDETAELAKPEDISAYVEERQEQETESQAPEDEVDALARQVRDSNPEFKEAKKASRYERLKRARDQYKAEAEELRSRLGQSAEPEAYSETQSSEPQASTPETAQLEGSLESARHMHGDAFQKAYDAFVEYAHRTRDQETYQRVMNSADPGQELVQWWNEQGSPEPSPEAYEAAIQQGRQEQDFQQQLAARDEQIRIQAETNLRVEAFAQHRPDYYEVMESVAGLDEVPNVMLELIKRSQFGPEIAYVMASDVWAADSKNLFEHAQSLADNPIGQAKMIGQMEQAIMTGRNQGTWPGGPAAPARATKAPPR